MGFKQYYDGMDIRKIIHLMILFILLKIISLKMVLQIVNVLPYGDEVLEDFLSVV